MAEASAAAMVTGERPISWASRARHGQSDWLPVINCGPGSTRTKKSLGSEDHILIETHHMSVRLMAKSMPLTASSPTRNMLNRGPRSISGSLCTMITACRSTQERQDLQGRNPERNPFNLIRVPRGCEPTGTASVNVYTTSVPNLGIYRTSRVRLSLVCCFNPRPWPTVGDAPTRRRQLVPQ